MDTMDWLRDGNRRFQAAADRALLEDLARNGQHPRAIVICCSDSRVVPERIFGADLGELFVIRVAGNVLDGPQLGSVEYAAGHLGCGTVLVLGHTGCGAVDAALHGGGGGYARLLTDEILAAAGEERDPDRVCRRNVARGLDRLARALAGREDLPALELRGAVYHLDDGRVEWLPPEAPVRG